MWFRSRIAFLLSSFIVYAKARGTGDDDITLNIKANTNLNDRSSCGKQSYNKIVGGSVTSPDEFPWTAILQYKASLTGTQFNCGGSLISDRYVLTAAHCVIGDIEKHIGKLHRVRLGEFNTQTDRDCQTVADVEICNEPAVDFEIEEKIVHPGFNNDDVNRYDDIALLKLKTKVRYSKFIQPICLPNKDESLPKGTNLTIAGWGKIQTISTVSPVKKKVQLPVVDTQECQKNYKKFKLTLRDTQICAGGEGDKDSCGGDSGGPMMKTFNKDSSQWFIGGIVSFGFGCGRKGFPGINTRVSSYLDWIQQNVKV